MAAAIVVAVALLAGAALAGAPAAWADVTIHVTTLEDPGPETCEGGGGCSLREALDLVGEGKVSGDVTILVDVEGTIRLGAKEEELRVESPAPASRN